jgi:hypothetical protein
MFQMFSVQCGPAALADGQMFLLRERTARKIVLADEFPEGPQSLVQGALRQAIEPRG